MADFWGALAQWLATAGGLGYSPWLPGTLGALPGLVLAWWMLGLSPRRQIAVLALAVVLALVLCQVAQSRPGGPDPSSVAADEYLTFPLAVVGMRSLRSPPALLTVFVLSRVLDGLKPPPARALELLPGGAGMVADDLVSNGWTALLAWGYLRWRRRRG